ncbi:MAG TPA: 3-oxoacyl-[acyl-carrier-protein] reductase [Proteobacteria bacterium]|nr:3-oxoacyl-[acyl-carrier-protein] reductase [Pseudomonadota bacterium]
MSFQGKVAIITGGSRGIGRAIALRLGGLGARVFVNYAANEKAALEVKEAIQKSGGTASIHCFNVSSYQVVQDFFGQVLEELGRIDILVNNAGVTCDGLLVRMKEEDWDRVLDVNLKGAFNCIRAVAKAMMKQRTGRIINISSVIGAVGNAGQANYAASKAGLMGLTRSVAKELAPRGICVNAIAPGYIESDMTAAIPEEIKKSLSAQIPLGRLGTPEDIADVVEFLSSDKAGYITGQVIHVNGGMFMG